MPPPGDQLVRYRTLMETARCFGRTMDLQTLIDEILNRSKEVMRAEACTLFLPDTLTGELILHSTDATLSALPEPLRVPPGKGIAGAVFQTREPINIRNAREDPRYFRPIADKFGFDSKAMLTIPLLEGADCVGVLQALNPLRRECFDLEDEEILEGFGGLIANALVRIHAEQQALELARSKQELVVAREIQESFLPPPIQKFPFAQVCMNYFPASAVGGDFCCVHAAGEKRLLLGLGDVTGKGIPAALTMARATAIIKALIPQLDDDLGKWVSLLNDQFVSDLQAGRFIGMTFMLADADRAKVQVCAAGQFAPVHFNGQEWTTFSAVPHLPLGIASAISYRATTAKLKVGESWLLFSDGIPEARNVADEEFTIRRLLDALQGVQCSARNLSGVVTAWNEFVTTAPQHDDASLLLLDWRGMRPPADLELWCCPDTLCQGRQFIENWAAFAGFDDVTIGQIVVACDEAATNVFRHAYGDTPGPLSINAAVDSEYLTIRLTDQATPIDPDKVSGRELSDLKPGGLGTYIINHVFDDAVYEPNSIGTTFILRKRLPAD